MVDDVDVARVNFELRMAVVPADNLLPARLDLLASLHRALRMHLYILAVVDVSAIHLRRLARHRLVYDDHLLVVSRHEPKPRAEANDLVAVHV